MPEKFYICTAIDYVNGKPHLGHAYEKILADVFARYHRSIKDDVFFLTGVDEFGQKNQQSAQKQNKAPQAFVDEMTAHFQALWKKLGLSNDRFVRTTNKDHQEKVQAALQKLHDKGEIYFQEYKGYYSVRQEQFVTEKEMVDGKWPEIYGDVVEMKEPNYFFKLSAYQDWLIDYVKKNENLILPAFRRNELLAALERPLNDLCISRPKSRLEWGIPLPFDPNFVTYVWFDALMNYVTYNELNGKGYWPCDAQVIGKDIMVPAHAIYWPIMLKALDLPIYKQLIVHGWWMIRGGKMSKSLGGTVDPADYAEKFGPDALRYFLMREMVIGQDADFTEEKFLARYQSDLGNDLGNLVNRALAMINRYRGGVVPEYKASDVTDAEKDLRADTVIGEYRNAMDGWQAHLGLQIIWKLVTRANQYVEENAPWKLAKDEAQKARLDVVLAHLAETVRRLSILVGSVMPTTSEKIQAQLALTKPQVSLDLAAFGTTLSGHKVGTPEPLFPRFEDAK